jgi:hypothetical protein
VFFVYQDTISAISQDLWYKIRVNYHKIGRI